VDIGLLLGCVDQRDLGKTFERWFGSSPYEYRRAVVA